MINIVLFGPPGAGKGTQAKKLISKYGLIHISTGDIMREEIKSGSQLGKEAAGYIEKGQLAPDNLVVKIISEHLSENRDVKGNIFDGFPRTTAQAEAFDQMLSEINEDVTLMISVDVPDEELVTRILIRAKDSGRADDSDINVIKNRIKVYKEQTATVADYYSAQGKFFAVDGLGTVEEVFLRICKHIDAAIQNAD